MFEATQGCVTSSQQASRTPVFQNLRDEIEFQDPRPNRLCIHKVKVLRYYCDGRCNNFHECKGSNIFEHQRQRNQCMDFGGSSICKHQRQRSSCKEYKGSSICEHHRRRTRCKECKGISGVETCERTYTKQEKTEHDCRREGTEGGGGEGEGDEKEDGNQRWKEAERRGRKTKTHGHIDT